ncbi:hypothetical protein BJ878DRAFT_415767 [Calycina marina]|uniref:BIR-domain-containing protein n=1 Tax=Calycina marina TaxID=1763456 RepID=A0A9P8CHM1_9HELO|nr:hypothetical protein BJ878DRAFT_415767 [Calycina marina]
MTLPPHLADQYFTYESRLHSFKHAQQLSKRRGSNVSTKGAKSLKWPHKFLEPERLAQAGFFYYPTQTNPDNVACFLCHKSFDGWEKGDDPLGEHLTLSPDCGWAIVATIETQDGDLSVEYPASARMMEARKATFASRWPHESKKGWKCKTKQLVDAGWKYTPTPESDDMATCTYCSLALDGWENTDKPIDEHFKRSAECPFFTLISEHKQSPTGKKTRGKKDRSSRASRLSTQSAITITSEAPSFVDMPAEEEDSILTAATNSTVIKKMGKAKKAPAAKGRKTRMKAETGPEPIEEIPAPAPEPEDDDFEPKVDVASKPTRGRKRKTEDLVEPTELVSEPPPLAKRRATRTRGIVAVDDSVPEKSTIIQQAPKNATRKGRNSTRKESTASVVTLAAPVPNDHEIDAALEADLARQVTDDEIEVEVPKPNTKPRKTAATSNHDIFGAVPLDIDEGEIEAELEAMEVDSKPLPKSKGGKGRPSRKVSAKQQTAAKRAAEAAAIREQAVTEEEDSPEQIAMEFENSISMQCSSPILQPKRQRATSRQQSKKLASKSPSSMAQAELPPVDLSKDPEEDENSGNETDVSVDSQSTVIHGGRSSRVCNATKGKAGKKVAIKHLEEIVHKPVTVLIDEEESASVPTNSNLLAVQTEDVSMADESPKIPSSKSSPIQRLAPATAIGSPAITINGVVTDSEHHPSMSRSGKDKGKQVVRSPTPPPKDRTPSQSPQSSDEENHPPSSKAPATDRKTFTPHSTTTRIPLAASTPTMSPSKRNIIAGLQSTSPWTGADVDHVFMKPTKDDYSSPGKLFVFNAMDKAKAVALTIPEKSMTVEDWILHNAAMAEEKMRNECEGMVGIFESQGTRALRALEGIQCVE